MMPTVRDRKILERKLTPLTRAYLESMQSLQYERRKAIELFFQELSEERLQKLRVQLKD